MFKVLIPVTVAALLLGACQQPQQAAAPTPVQRVVPPTPVPTSVYFDTGSSALSQRATASIEQVAADYKTKDNATVSLTGHTDTVGSAQSNAALAGRRVEAVRSALVGQGVPAGAITTTAHGEVTLPVQTADNVNEPRNRNVDIAIVVPVARLTDAEYCAALSTKYREYRTSQIDEEAAAAMAKCAAGNTAAGIPVLEKHLTLAKIALPAR